MITRKLKLMLLPLFTLFALASCTVESEQDTPNRGKSNEVVFTMRIPGNNSVTRALDTDNEYEVKTLDVLVFNNSTGKLMSHATNSGTPVVTPVAGGRDVNFYIKLEKDDNVSSYDFLLLANAYTLIKGNSTIYPGGTLNTNATKANVQANLIESLTAGTGWINNPAATNYKAMPMWGELNAQPIEAGRNYPKTTLLRSTVKINLAVDLDNAGDTFDLEEVWYYNYNTKGYVIPLAANISGGKATAPTIDNTLGFNKSNPINYSSGISTNKQTLNGMIYGFEGPQGSIDDDKYMDNPCLVVKGSFNGGAGSWYRLDFANVDPADLSSTYLPLLRNHQYNVAITAINGDGYEDKNDAYNSKPGNVATNVTQWNEEGINGGVFNGTYEILYSTREVNFTQFGEPSQHVITITTNVPGGLKFENFTKASGPNDGEWTESPAGTFSNNHFKMVVTSNADKTEYKLTITAKPSVKGDARRDWRFKAKGKNLEANFKITQDTHIEYRLLTDPDDTTPIVLDGARQRIKINVSSTHNYTVVLNKSGSLFTAIYDQPTGGSAIPSADIPKEKTTIYIEVDQYGGIDPRVGTFLIKHKDPASDAAELIFNALQVTPVIKASLLDGTYTAEVQRGASEKTIKVESNMSKWVPVLKIKNGSGTNDLVNDISGYFDLTQGSQNGNVVFRIPALAEGATEGVEYTITFKDGNGGTTESSPVIKITQVAKLSGSGGGGIPPTGGVRAEENILSVNGKGQLNLDGPYDDGTSNWIVYFKWGSTIAVAGGPNGDEFTAEKVAWVPEEYDYDALMTTMIGTSARLAFGTIPYAGSNYPANTPENLAAGLGDPCRFAIKEGYNVGDFKTPEMIGGIYPQIPTIGWVLHNGSRGHWYNKGQTDQQFYPATGILTQNGIPSQVGSVGGFRSSTPTSKNSFYHSFSNIQIFQQELNNNAGAAIRCVYDPQP